MSHHVEDSSEDDRPAAVEAAIPEFAWKVLQGVLTAVMLAVLSWAWKLETRLARNEQLVEEGTRMEQQISSLQTRLEQERARTDDNFMRIQLVENEIKHIREGVDDIKVMLSERQRQPTPVVHAPVIRRTPLLDALPQGNEQPEALPSPRLPAPVVPSPVPPLPSDPIPKRKSPWGNWAK